MQTVSRRRFLEGATLAIAAGFAVPPSVRRIGRARRWTNRRGGTSG